MKDEITEIDFCPTKPLESMCITPTVNVLQFEDCCLGYKVRIFLNVIDQISTFIKFKNF